MQKKKNLYPLYFFMLPAFGGLAYSAFCYYYNEWSKNSTSSELAKVLKQLTYRLKNTTSIWQIKTIYDEAYKNINKYVTDPSFRRMKVANSNSQIKKKENSFATPYKGEVTYKVNEYNTLTEKREGMFIFGLWFNVDESSFNGMKNHDQLIRIGKGLYGGRKEKCLEHARKSKQDLDKEMLDSYEECISRTNESVAKLERSINFMEKFSFYQIP